MPQNITTYICQKCGNITHKWVGKCENCQEWNTMLPETAIPQNHSKNANLKNGQPTKLYSLNLIQNLPDKIISHISEFDRTIGGGIVPGSVTLIGGEPGIGKSTLILQIMAQIAKNYRAIYFSGEEAVQQIAERAKRLNIDQNPLMTANETEIANIIATITQKPKPNIIAIDSIHTIWNKNIDSSPGSIIQLRNAAEILVRYAKNNHIALVLIGHVTKEGNIAGPKTIEHMVDTVIYFETENIRQFRILRTVKNRFGPIDEIGIFTMQKTGLKEEKNPSKLFVSQQYENNQGTAVFAAIQGIRPILTEFQALVTNSNYATPKRTVVGWGNNRLATLIAVIEAQTQTSLATKDIYLNVAGGLNIKDPAADLPAAAAILASLAKTAIEAKTILCGEISLSGEIRPAAHTQIRLNEAAKLGFKKALIPKQNTKDKNTINNNLTTIHINHISQLAKWIYQQK